MSSVASKTPICGPMLIAQGRISDSSLKYQRLAWDGVSLVKVISDRPVTFSSKCQAFDKTQSLFTSEVWYDQGRSGDLNSRSPATKRTHYYWAIPSGTILKRKWQCFIFLNEKIWHNSASIRYALILLCNWVLLKIDNVCTMLWL